MSCALRNAAKRTYRHAVRAYTHRVWKSKCFCIVYTVLADSVTSIIVGKSIIVAVLMVSNLLLSILRRSVDDTV